MSAGNIKPIEDGRILAQPGAAVTHRHSALRNPVHILLRVLLYLVLILVGCTMILPLRAQGNSGSPVRPVAIGAPAQ